MKRAPVSIFVLVFAFLVGFSIGERRNQRAKEIEASQLEYSRITLRRQLAEDARRLREFKEAIRAMDEGRQQ